MAELARKPATKAASTNGTSATASATSFAANTWSRGGRWVKSVFSVPQPYSLPSVNTPSMSAKTPPKNGNPVAMLPTTDCGRSSTSGCSTGLSRYVAYGTAYAKTSASAVQTPSRIQVLGRLRRMRSSARMLPVMRPPSCRR